MNDKERKHQWYLKNKERLHQKYLEQLKLGSPKSRYLVRCETMKQNTSKNATCEVAKQPQTKGGNTPFSQMSKGKEEAKKKNYRWNWLEKHGIIIEKPSLINNCIDCGGSITDRYGGAIRCIECSKKERDRHNENRLQKLFKKKKIGSSSNSLLSHMTKDIDGDPNFQRELKKVEKEKQRVFVYGGNLPYWK